MLADGDLSKKLKTVNRDSKGAGTPGTPGAVTKSSCTLSELGEDRTPVPQNSCFETLASSVMASESNRLM